MSAKPTVHIIPSSHWDREWYLPFRRFQFRLTKMMDRALNILEQQEDNT